jgi:serine O-acetyltransferase
MINLYHVQKVAHQLYRWRVPVLPKVLYYLQFVLFNSSVPPSVRIGSKTRFAYGGIGTVIHSNCVIGEKCIIGQCVTFGGDGKRRGVPLLGNNVYIGAGARLLGPIVIGDNARIGANAVVLVDVPPGKTAVGIPATVLVKSSV